MHAGEATAEIDPAVGAGRRVVVIMGMIVIPIMGVRMGVAVIVSVVMMVMIVRMAVIMAIPVRMIMIVGMALPRVDARVAASAHRTHQSTSSSLTRSSSPAVTCN